MELGIGNRTAGNCAVFDGGLKTEIVKRNRDRKNLKLLSIYYQRDNNRSS